MATSCNSFSIDILNMVAFSQGNMFDQFDPGADGIASQSDVDLSRFRISNVGSRGPEAAMLEVLFWRRISLNFGPTSKAAGARLD